MRMTTGAAPTIPSRLSPEERPRRLTEVVTTRAQRRARPRVVHAVVAVAGLLAIVGAQLLLTIAISGGAYRISDLQDEARDLTRQSEALAEQLEIAGATQRLAASAAALGMVPAGATTFVDLADGGSYVAPGMPDALGCGGSCALVANTLTGDLPQLVDRGAALESASATGTEQASVADAPTASTGIPVPVTD